MLRELATAMGSSPRVRGKQHADYDARLRARLIPARAGKTVGVEQVRPHRWAHPRACGENAS